MKVDSILEKMRKNLLRWFGHLKRRPLSAHIWKCNDINPNHATSWGRPKLTRTSINTNRYEGVTYDDLAFDHIEWWKKIHVADRKWLGIFRVELRNDMLRTRSKQTLVHMTSKRNLSDITKIGCGRHGREYFMSYVLNLHTFWSGGSRAAMFL